MTNDSMPKSTQKLVTALTAEKAPEWLVEMARKNDFHDFLTSSATPMHDLILHASAVEGMRRMQASAEQLVRENTTLLARAERAETALAAVEREDVLATNGPEGQIEHSRALAAALETTRKDAAQAWRARDEARAALADRANEIAGSQAFVDAHRAVIAERSAAISERDAAIAERSDTVERWRAAERDFRRVTTERDALSTSMALIYEGNVALIARVDVLTEQLNAAIEGNTAVFFAENDRLRLEAERDELLRENDALRQEQMLNPRASQRAREPR